MVYGNMDKDGFVWKNHDSLVDGMYIIWIRNEKDGGIRGDSIVIGIHDTE